MKHFRPFGRMLLQLSLALVLVGAFVLVRYGPTNLLPNYIGLALQLLGFCVALHAVMVVHSPQGATGWALSLIAVPVVAIPLYWVFGRSRFSEYVKALRQLDLDVHERLGERHLGGRDYFVQTQDPSALEAQMNALSHLPATRGNRVELLINGPQMLDALLPAIDAAQDYVLAEYYTVEPDGTGRKFFDALIRAARRGVAVYFLYDDVGSSALKKRHLRPLREAGVHVAAFSGHRSRLLSRSRLNFRNHRKIVICDGRVAFTGGINIGDAYMSLHKKLAPWRDTHLRIHGPAVQAVQLVLVRDWFYADGGLPELCWEPQVAQGVDQQVLIMSTGPDDRIERGSLFFRELIDAARERVWIATPYFIPDKLLLSSLQMAALRGAEVRVMVPRKSDNPVFKFAPYAYLREVEELGGQIWFYEPGFAHQKILLIDHSHAVVGSANLDNRSLSLNFEVNALVSDADFAAQVEAMLLRDFEQARATTLGDLEQRRLPFRVAARVTRLASPVL